jgi:hypothetical protein
MIVWLGFWEPLRARCTRRTARCESHRSGPAAARPAAPRDPWASHSSWHGGQGVSAVVIAVGVRIGVGSRVKALLMDDGPGHRVSPFWATIIAAPYPNLKRREAWKSAARRTAYCDRRASWSRSLARRSSRA